MTDKELFEKVCREGECWHEFTALPEHEPVRLGSYGKCACGAVLAYNTYINYHLHHNPDFSTPDGFFLLWDYTYEREDEKFSWKMFVDYCWSNAGVDIYVGDKDGVWAGLPFKYIHRTRFTEVLKEFLSQKEQENGNRKDKKEDTEVAGLLRRRHLLRD